MSTSRSAGVDLDPTNPHDRIIIARQVKAARQAGREGRDRARTTRGRLDLESAYDEGAAENAPAHEDQDDEDQDDEEAPAPAGPGFLRRAMTSGPGWGSVKPRMPTGRTRMKDAGGVLAGALLYTVVIVYVRYGPSGWTGWLSAKFLNKPMSGQSGAGTPAGTGKEAAA